jgi:hypothetical protein
MKDPLMTTLKDGGSFGHQIAFTVKIKEDVGKRIVINNKGWIVHG